MDTAINEASSRSNGTIVAGRPIPAFQHIGVTPLTGAAGAEITGVDIGKPLERPVLDEIMLAFEHFLVIMFRKQDITPEQHKAFSKYFGPLTELPQAPIYPGHRDMQEVRREAHEPVSVVPFEKFHTDSPFLPTPPLCIAMRALDVPKYGGDTAFANMYLAYDMLSEGLKRVVDTLQVVYSCKDVWSNNAKLEKDRQLRLRESHDFTEDQLESIHPAVRRHPRTGRKALFVTQAYFKRFVGWNEADSRALLDYLVTFPNRLDTHCRIRWEPNTLIVWDNRFLQHRGIHDYENERRHLIRTTVEGERPQ